MVERLREHLLLEEVYSGGVCLVPELKAKLEDHNISSKCRLTIEVGAALKGITFGLVLLFMIGM